MQNMQNPQTNIPIAPEPMKEEDQPWYMKYGVRGLGTVAGGLAMLLGALNLIFSIFSPTCILFSIWQILVGFVVATIESPCCCVFVEHVNKVTSIIEAKPLWMKSAVYCGASIFPIIFCIGFYTVIGSGLILATGGVYGMMALGKKASRSEMAMNAARNNLSYTNSSTLPQTNTPSSRPYAPSWGPPSSGLTGEVPASLHTKKESPPPSYTDLQAPSKPMGWDTSYITASNTSLSTPHQQPPPPSSSSVNPGNPYNPFQ